MMICICLVITSLTNAFTNTFTNAFINNNKYSSYLEIKIETGRKHQIRKHLAQKRYPILGDKKYAGTGNSFSLEQSRHMLHASSLIFNHPCTDKKISIKASIPLDFNRCLKQLKLS